MIRSKGKRLGGAVLCLWLLLFPVIGFGADADEMDKLKTKIGQQDALIQEQQRTIQQLVEKMAALEAKVMGPASAKQRVNLAA